MSTCWNLRAGGILAFAAIACISMVFAPTLGAQAAAVSRTEVGQIAPNQPGAESAAPALTPAQLEALIRLKLEIRERLAAQVDNNPPGPSGLPDVAVPATDVSRDPPALMETFDVEHHLPLAAFVTGRNYKNLRASTVGVGNPLAEPAAINDGYYAFYMGNTHQEYSLSGGSVFTGIAVP
ncbi:MAG: hypothetical protein AAB225_32035, partial [Acidobacteriota bacterium]